jgi:hypothetical protein
VLGFYQPSGIRFAESAGNGAWSISTVRESDELGALIYGLAIAADADGVFHILCSVQESGSDAVTLFYLRSDDLGSPEVVDTGRVLSQPHVAIGTDGRVCVIYSASDGAEGVSMRVRYAERGNGGWRATTIDEIASGYPGGLVVDTNGIPHICFVEPGDLSPEGGIRHVMYGVRRSTVWETYEVMEGLNAYPSAIGIDTKGVVHIACHDQGNGDLLYICVSE